MVAKYYVHVSAYVPATVSVNPTSIDLEKDATYQINAVVNDDATNKALTYESNKTNIATVSSTGLVTAKAKGVAEITIKTADNNTAKLTVNVTEPTAAQTFTFNDENGDPHTLVVAAGSEATLDSSYHFTYANNSYVYDGDSSCYFTISQRGSYFLEYFDENMTIFGYYGGPVYTYYTNDEIEITLA